MTGKQELEQFEAAANEPHRWQHTAREFIRAANYLLDWHDVPLVEADPGDLECSHYGTNSPMLVLYAVAIENLLKAVLLAQGSRAVSGGKLSNDFSHHNLTRYADDAGLVLNADQRPLLDRLHDVIQAGRYPVAKAPSRNPGAWQLHYPGDVERIWSILECLEDALRATGKPCLPPVDLRKRYRPPGYDVPERA